MFLYHFIFVHRPSEPCDTFTKLLLVSHCRLQCVGKSTPDATKKVAIIYALRFIKVFVAEAALQHSKKLHSESCVALLQSQNINCESCAALQRSKKSDALVALRFISFKKSCGAL